MRVISWVVCATLMVWWTTLVMAEDVKPKDDVATLKTQVAEQQKEIEYLRHMNSYWLAQLQATTSQSSLTTAQSTLQSVYEWFKGHCKAEPVMLQPGVLGCPGATVEKPWTVKEPTK